jgi:hypothetical protein
MRPFVIALPAILAACSQEATPPPPANVVERPTAPDPAAPLSTPAASQSPSPAGMMPEVFRGEWNRVTADCGTARNDSRLRIEAKQVRFHESSGEVLRVREDGRTIAVRARYTGEGETWEDERRFTLSADGKTLSADGIDRVRCP